MFPPILLFRVCPAVKRNILSLGLGDYPDDRAQQKDYSPHRTESYLPTLFDIATESFMS